MLQLEVFIYQFNLQSKYFYLRMISNDYEQINFLKNCCLSS